MDGVGYQHFVIQDLKNDHVSGQLDLNPWYQRRSVWTKQQKSYLINTLFENKPIPTIYIRHYIDIEKEKSIKEVVDGQQRFRAILEYVENKHRARHPNHDNKLVFFKDLTKAEKRTFLMTRLSIGTLVNADDTDVIEIFGRLNSVAKTLNAQEKRNAKYGGEFKQFSLREAAKRVQIWRDLNVFSANEIARMIEVQFISDLTINLINGLSDYTVRNIDKYYKDNDDSFSNHKSVSSRIDKVFNKIVSLNPSAIKDTIFSRAPIFFSLFIVLDDMKCKIRSDELEKKLFKIDAIYNSDKPLNQRPQQESDFYLACTSSTQRIKSRNKRNLYIKRILLK